jgi:hypothetical protein
MRYRLVPNLDLRPLCDQPLRLQEIVDSRGHSIILALGDNGQVMTLAYALRQSPTKPASALKSSRDGQGSREEG